MDLYSLLQPAVIVSPEKAVVAPAVRGVSADVVVGTAFACAMALAAMLVAYYLLDFSLGLLFCVPVVVVGVLLPVSGDAVPPTVAVLRAGVLCVAAAAVVAFASFAAGQFNSRWPQLFLLVLAVACCLEFAVRLLVGLRLPSSVARSVVLLIFLIWFTLPVWASAWFLLPSGQIVANYVLDYQPLIALNGAYPELGDWTHHPIMYTRLTNLGQDVFFALPASAWPSIAAHTIVAVIGGSVCGGFHLLRGKQFNSM